MEQIKKIKLCDSVDIDQTNTPANDGIYCDSTQFAIEALFKINEIISLFHRIIILFTCPQSFKNQK
jgi:hypothetical protein